MRWIGIAAALLPCALPSLPAPAQTQGTVVDLVLGWVRGDWRSPLLCTFDGETHQGLRRVLIVAGPPQSERPVDRVTFQDLDARSASRCNTALGGDAPNIVGTVLLSYTDARPYSDTPQRDFKELLRGGRFDFGIESGRLRIGSPKDAVEKLPEVDFAGGHARITDIPATSDTARLLHEFGPRRRLRIVLDAPNGTQVDLPLVEFGHR
jgi:hypothetical protein